MRTSTLLATLMAATNLAMAATPLRVVSFNIRYAASSREDNEKPWWDLLCGISASRCRQPHVIKLLSDISSTPATANAPSVIGLQEVLKNQLDDIVNGLGSDKWDHIGVGRDDGKESGEFSPIIYRPDQLRVVFSETKWLSPTPDEVSFGWGAGSRRVVTLAVFENIATGTKFISANTHLDNVSSQARSEGAKVVLARIAAAQAAHGPGLGVTLTGDFNSAPGQDAFEAIKGSGEMSELFDLAGDKRVGTNQLTYTGFSDTGISRIDFIWLGPVAGSPKWDVQRYEIVGNKVDGVFASDHRPVVGDVTIV